MKRKNIIFFFIATAMIVNCNAAGSLDVLVAGVEVRLRMYDELVAQNDALVCCLEQSQNMPRPETTWIVGTGQEANPFACPPIEPLFDRRIEEAVAGLRTQLEEQAASFEVERQRMTAQHERAMASLRSELQRASAAEKQRLQDVLTERNAVLVQRDQALRDAQTRADGLNTEVRRLQVQAALVPDLRRQVNGISVVNAEVLRLQEVLAERNAEIERMATQYARAFQATQTRAEELQRTSAAENQRLQDVLTDRDAAIERLTAQHARALQAAQTRAEELHVEMTRLQHDLAARDARIERLQAQADIVPDLQRQVQIIPGLHTQIRQLQEDLQVAQHVRPVVRVVPPAAVIPPLGQQPAPIRVVPPVAVVGRQPHAAQPAAAPQGVVPNTKKHFNY
ncbi:MAG TPA: hypothetical protein DIC42_06040 [Holosporales bacterium]|nr:hypothetical protein [Holosporales bacterium]